MAGSLIGIDALHTQQETARQVVQEAGADYLLTVKANQKELRQTLAQRLPKPEQLFSPPEPLPPQWAHTGPQKNRGRHEIRTLCATVINPEQARFPGAAQCAIILRQGLGDQPDPQYLLTSRAPEHLPARQWLEGQRDYWGIEAGLHQRLDVSADEDRSRVRHRNAVWVLAMFRRISVSLFYALARAKHQTGQGYPARLPRRNGLGTSAARLRPRRLEEIHSLGEFMSQPWRSAFKAVWALNTAKVQEYD